MDSGDSEKAIFSHEEHNKQKYWTTWIPVLVAGAFMLSLLAFIMVTAVVLLQLWHGTNQLALDVDMVDANTDMNHDAEDLTLGQSTHTAGDKPSIHMQARRRVRSCSSLYDNSTNSAMKPSAHITGFGSLMSISAISGSTYSVVSKKWFCDSKFASAHTLGGMHFDRLTGYLTVPVTGVYFVYSQLHLVVRGDVDTERTLKHRTVFSCNYNLHPEIKMESLSSFNTSGGLQPTYQGGVFRLNAGQCIGVTVGYGSAISDLSNYMIKSHLTRSFMGAYLVSKE